jgi:predicted nicotinamide N-methyase
MDDLTDQPAPPASAPLLASLRDELAAVLGREPDPELLDAGLRAVPLPGGELLVARPRDWRALRAVDAAAGRPTPYWALPWPSGVALARTIAARDLDGVRVLELGCGLAVPSIVAARAGADVLAVDVAAEAAVYAAHNLVLNEALGETAVLDWRDAQALQERGPWDLVLGADLLYLRDNVESLLRVLPRLIAPEGEALIADPGRSGAAEFLPVARRLWRLESRADALADGVTVHRLAGRR